MMTRIQDRQVHKVVPPRKGGMRLRHLPLLLLATIGLFRTEDGQVITERDGRPG